MIGPSVTHQNDLHGELPAGECSFETHWSKQVPNGGKVWEADYMPKQGKSPG